MNVVINPGSGPALGATEANAEQNMLQFIADLAKRGRPGGFARAADKDYGDGRYAYIVEVAGRGAFEVQMPGLPLDAVRWLGRDQDIWQFPRLYVDGNSWIWFFALNCFDADDGPERDANNTVAGAVEGGAVDA